MERTQNIADGLTGGVGKTLYTDLAHYFRQKIEADLKRDDEEDIIGL